LVETAQRKSQILVALHATNLGQLLKDVPFFFVHKTLLERSLFVADTLGSRGETWGRHVQQEVGAIHPVDMRHHGIKAMGGDILKTQVLFDCFMKKLHGPTHPLRRFTLTDRCGKCTVLLSGFAEKLHKKDKSVFIEKLFNGLIFL